MTSALELRLYHGVRRRRDLALAPVAAVLARLGVAPWAVSLVGVAAALCTFVVPPERNDLAFAALACALAADALDGAVARRAGRCSATGKLFDQGCDAATFAALVLAAAARGLAPWSLALAAAVACTLATGAALRASARRDPEAFRAAPRAGFWGHVPKLPFAAAYPVALLGGAAGAALLPPALALSAVLGALVAAAQALRAAVSPVPREAA